MVRARRRRTFKREREETTEKVPLAIMIFVIILVAKVQEKNVQIMIVATILKYSDTMLSRQPKMERLLAATLPLMLVMQILSSFANIVILCFSATKDINRFIGYGKTHLRKNSTLQLFSALGHLHESFQGHIFIIRSTGIKAA